MTGLKALLPHILEIHARIRTAVRSACEENSLEDLAKIDRNLTGDTIYAIDVVGETILVDYVEEHLARETTVVLIAEGLEDGSVVLPVGTEQEKADWRIIVDPIDGTRGLMYQKRSAWILTGVARNRGPDTSLQDIELAVQSEIPLVKQYLCDTLWAFQGGQLEAKRLNCMTGEETSFTPRPSRAETIAHGFASISRFFPGARDVLASIDEEMVLAALGPVQEGKAHCFEDQYIASGGQLYELIMGHDRFIADLRPLMETILARQGLSLGICCRPYDLCTELIARRAGVIITDPWGQPLQAPLTVQPDVAWVGYANPAIQAQMEPLLRKALRKRLGNRV